MRSRYLVLFVLFVVVISACASTPRGAERKDASDWTIIVMPDTQYYSATYPDVFVSQTEWIADMAQRGEVDLVIQLGDVVDADSYEQWDVADSAFSVLDGIVPYTLAAGNHDLQWDGTRDSKLSQYFPPSRLGLLGTANAGTFEDGRSENSWQIVELNGEKLLVMVLEYWPRDDVIVWANDVLNSNSTISTIIATHSFLFDDGTRYGEPNAPEHPWGPAEHQHVTGYGPNDANDSETIYQELVAPNSQVFLVLSGHVLNSGVARRSDVRADGTKAHQVLQNYQMRPQGGEGYLRIYERYGEDLEVRTYSPYMNEWLNDGENRFVLKP